jgi:hypothetical protein
MRIGSLDRSFKPFAKVNLIDLRRRKVDYDICHHSVGYQGRSMPVSVRHIGRITSETAIERTKGLSDLQYLSDVKSSGALIELSCPCGGGCGYTFEDVSFASSMMLRIPRRLLSPERHTEYGVHTVRWIMGRLHMNRV